MKDQHPNHRSDKVAHDWRDANWQAIMSSNDWVEAHGLPLQAHRLF